MIYEPLPPNTRELLLALNAEFYSGPLAHADAFRILPRVAAELEKLRSTVSGLVKLKDDLVNQNRANWEQQNAWRERCIEVESELAALKALRP